MANRINVGQSSKLVRAVARRTFVFVFGATAFATFAQTNIELRGRVLDRATKKPIEGAYVIAGYHEKIVGPAVVKQWCVRTRGAITGPDGSYHFPVEKLDGMSPASVSAIKPGYYFDYVQYPDKKTWKKQDASSYAGRDIYLSPQDEKKLEYSYGPEDKFCYHAKTSADAAASVEFLKIQLAEYIRLGVNERQVGAVRDMIRILEGIDTAPPGALNPLVPKVSR